MRAVRIVSAVMAGSLASGAASARIDWKDDYSLADTLDVAAHRKIPAIVYFGAEWCSFCRKLERETLESPLLEKAVKDYLAVRFDVDTEMGADAARRLGIQGLPAIALLDPAGRVVARLAGFRTDQQLVEAVEKDYLAVLPPETLLDPSGEPSGPPETLLRVGQALSAQGKLSEAGPYLEKAAEGAERGGETAVAALLELAAVALRQDRRDAALAALQRAFAEAASDASCRQAGSALISLLRETRRSEEEMAVWRQLAGRLADDAGVQADYARALLEHGAPPDQALEVARRAITLDPQSGDAHTQAADALLRLGRFADALEAAQKAIVLVPAEKPPRLIRLRALEELRKQDGKSGSSAPKGRRR